MHIQNFLSSLVYSISISSIIFILINSSTANGQDDEQYFNCSSPFSCGRSFQGIRYPFWGGNRSRDCGLQGFGLRCLEDDYLTIDIANQTFRVLRIDGSNPALTIARNDLWDDTCPDDNFLSTELANSTTFSYGPGVQNLSLFYSCPSISSPGRKVFNCSGSTSTAIFPHESLPIRRCSENITIPVLQRSIDDFISNTSMSLQELVNIGFIVEYSINFTACSACERSGGLCWANTNSETPLCLCPDVGASPNSCFTSTNGGGGLNVGRKVGIAFGAAGVGAIFMCLVFFFYQRRKKRLHSGSTLISREISSYPSSVSDPEKAGSYFGVHVFTYIELEEATNNFDPNKVLGDGGFGTVYRGELQDGRTVAVKRLFENNFKMVEQFMNEVEILTRMRHQHLVSLYGCTSRHSRELLLVYEYVPNGTVACHLHGHLTRPKSLSWTTRMNIAIETASALAFLHASDVIHRDVKTNNILLDNNFGVKVADFGLSRLFPTNATHISTAPQGTPGYVDPEYHQCYHLTDKSDVYSFGVVLMELISSKPAVDITRHRHEINLSNMAINKIQNHALHELVDPDLGFVSDYKVRIMITAVAELAFQCLQYERDMRPSMHEVLRTLLGIKEHSIGMVCQMDIPAEDVGFLKSIQSTFSPESLIADWNSRSTTSTTSS